MSKNLDAPTVKQRLAQAEQELANKLGHDMVTKQGMETFSAYQKFMRTAKTADQPPPYQLNCKRNNSSNNSENGRLTIGTTKLTTRHSIPSY